LEPLAEKKMQPTYDCEALKLELRPKHRTANNKHETTNNQQPTPENNINRNGYWQGIDWFFIFAAPKMVKS